MIKTMLMLGNEKTTIIPYVCLIFGYILFSCLRMYTEKHEPSILHRYINDKE